MITGVTILLSLTVFLNMVAETMPATSDAVPLLGTYFNCIMFMVASSVVSTILILNYHHRHADTHEMSDWVSFYLDNFFFQNKSFNYFFAEVPSIMNDLTDFIVVVQIRCVFLYWLPWVLRMSRPGSATTPPPARAPPPPDLELRERSSKSLLANVLDIDDDFRHAHSQQPPCCRYYRSLDDLHEHYSP